MTRKRPVSWLSVFYFVVTLWGGSGSQTFVFSPLNQVEQELGGLTTF